MMPDAANQAITTSGWPIPPVGCPARICYDAGLVGLISFISFIAR
jgi:hypothetical protein